MANNNQQKKRIRQDEKRRARNSSIKSSIRTAQKKIMKSFDAKDKPGKEEIDGLMKKLIKTIDTAAQKGVVHKKTAARKKSRLSRKINTFLQQA